ncbi:MAG TPA: hypothetical protein VF444_06930 [Pseudonocardiaceae bacterium]
MTSRAVGVADSEGDPAAAGKPAGRWRVSVWRRPAAPRDPLLWLVAVVAALLGAIFVAADLYYNQGKLIAPLDDVYIHLQYGREIGEGHFFQFNTGDPISTGASSLLYALILGAAYAVGFKGTLLLVFAVAFGILCWAVATALVYRLGCALVSRAVGLWTALLVACSGVLAWGSSSGMEVGFTMLLVTGTLLILVREMPNRHYVLAPVAAMLLAVTRPEGLIFAVALCGAELWTLGASRKSLGLARAARFGVWTLLPLVAGAAQLLFYKIATGTFEANGVQAKMMLYDEPVFYLGQFADRVAANLHGIVGLFSGFTEQDYAFPGASLLVLVGLIYLLVARPAWRPLLVGIAVGLAGVVLSVSTLDAALWHRLRYVQPFVPIFLMFAASGVHGLTRVIPAARTRRLVTHGVLAVALLFSLVAVPSWAVDFGRATGTIRDTDISAGGWISGNLPPGATVAVKDLGAVAYFGDHPVIDLIGLGTNGMAQASTNGVGAVYEALRHLPPNQRPEYFLLYDQYPGPNLSLMTKVGVLENPPMMAFQVQAPTDLNGNRIVPFTELDLYKADWTLAGSGDVQQVPGQLRDYLNVGDLSSEKAHSYQPNLAQIGIQPYTTLTKVGDVVDSGRPIVGGETFTAGNLTPGQELTITARSDVKGDPTLTSQPSFVPDMRVLVNGVAVGTWNRLPSTDDAGWATYTYTIPGNLITGSSARIQLQPLKPLLNPYPNYDSYGYWFSQ